MRWAKFFLIFIPSALAWACLCAWIMWLLHVPDGVAIELNMLSGLIFGMVLAFYLIDKLDLI